MKDEGAPRHWREGGKGLWPHDDRGGDVERMSRHMGMGWGKSPGNGVGEQKEWGMS